MPRKKQGLRSYHHKSRNGCSNCKRRRVKCSMQAPACAHCVRRKELCEYQTFCADGPVPPSWSTEPTSLANMRLTDTASNISVVGTASYTSYAGSVSRIGSDPGAMEGTLVFTSPLKTCIESVLSTSWFTPPERELWSRAILSQASKYPYLQQGLYSLAALIPEYHGPYENEKLVIPGVPIAAYHHHLTASTLFRQAPPVMNEHNWVAVLAFGISMTIFQFAVQQSCSEEEFDILQTIRVLRNSMAVNEECKPYLVKSKFWPYVADRARLVPKSADVGLRTALQQLSQVIQQAIDSEYPHAETYRHAFHELHEWAYEFCGKPRIWRHYLVWPAAVTEEYLTLVAEGDDVALLILIYWCAIMHQTPKRYFATAWTRRTVRRAVGLLDSDWKDVLAWPMVVLGQTDLLATKEMPLRRPLDWPEPISLCWG